VGGSAQTASRPLLEREWIVKIKRFGVLGFALLALGCMGLSSKVEAQQKVVIYSSNDDTLHKLVFTAFTKETGIAVEPISAGSGVVMRRIQTEKDRPGGDIVWGVSRSLLDINKQYFSAYLSKNHDATPAEYRDPGNLWIGNNLHLLVILQNTKALPEDQGPKTWADLLDPKWKGKIAFTDPPIRVPRIPP
jgi:iron(III) transport system substrate-binding protein